MAMYRFSRLLAGAVRAGGLLALAVAIFLVAAGNAVVAGFEGWVILLGAIGVVLSLLGGIALAVFDGSEALQRAFPAAAPGVSPKSADPRLAVEPADELAR